jgi:hypothetical protein
MERIPPGSEYTGMEKKPDHMNVVGDQYIFMPPLCASLSVDECIRDGVAAGIQGQLEGGISAGEALARAEDSSRDAVRSLLMRTGKGKE